MSEDFSNIVNNFSKILEDKNIDLNSILSSINSKNSEKVSTNPAESVENSFSFSNFDNFDLNTLLKLKNVMSKLNSTNDYRANLLLSLKPYLRDSKKQKLDQYIQILKLLTVIESLDLDGGLRL